MSNGMREAQDPSHWLYLYGNKQYYAWKQRETDQRTSFHRPLGLVEAGFDADGRYFEGRADLNSEWTLAVAGTNVQNEWRERLVLAWAVLRGEHVLLQSRTEAIGGGKRGFVVDVPRTVDEAKREAEQNMTFLEDHFAHFDHDDFYFHSQNAARVFDPDTSLTRLFVYGLQDLHGEMCLKTLLVAAHQICDGLSMAMWNCSFIHLMNLSRQDLTRRLSAAILPTRLFARLPPAQEALYPPPISKPTPVRLRWFWLLTRIRRHVRRPLAQAIPNPLHRPVPLPLSPLPKTYHPLLAYTRQPPLMSRPLFTRIPLPQTTALHTLCRRNNVSIGAGLFALVAHITTHLPPSNPVTSRIPLPFKTGFPLNPRPFLSSSPTTDTPLQPDSLMLAFSEGIVLPYLPPLSSTKGDGQGAGAGAGAGAGDEDGGGRMSLEKRLSWLAKSAHRQLGRYQKRKSRRINVETTAATIAAAAAGGGGGGGGGGESQESNVLRGVIAEGYLGSLERVERLLPEELRGKGGDAQGGYPVPPGSGQGTCGVSSVGRREDLIWRGMYDVGSGKEWVADWRDTRGTVRARDGEFLVGIGGDEFGIWVSATVDVSMCDEGRLEEWRKRFETSLDGLITAKL